LTTEAVVTLAHVESIIKKHVKIGIQMTEDFSEGPLTKEMWLTL